MQIKMFSFVAATAIAAFPVSVSTAIPAAADCISSSGVDVCSEGDSPDSGGLTFPYPCELDWYCVDSSLSLLDPEFDLSPPSTGGLNESRDPDRGGRSGGVQGN